MGVLDHQSQEFRFLLDSRDPLMVFEQGSDIIYEREQCLVWTGEGKHWELRNLLGRYCTQR